jgi:hypothetical protein
LRQSDGQLGMRTTLEGQDLDNHTSDRSHVVPALKCTMEEVRRQLGIMDSRREMPSCPLDASDRRRADAERR